MRFGMRTRRGYGRESPMGKHGPEQLLEFLNSGT